MMKFLILFFILSSVPQMLSAQTTTEGTVTDRPFNSIADQGFYWDNALRARWNSFGACYRTRLYYRGALHRSQNSFWFANSAYEIGIEQGISSGSRTSAFFFWQPVIAVNFMLKAGYYYDFVGYALLDGSNDEYNHALPPLTGLNPQDRKPIRADRSDLLEIEFSPTFTFGGKVGDGMLALIYTPSLFYLHNFGVAANQYYLHNREVVVVKGQDIFWRHDIKLGYALSGTGMSVALTGSIEHVQSYAGVFRASVYGSFSYEKALERFPNLVPFFRGQMGAVVHDRYMNQYFSIQIDTGLKYKF